MASDGEAGASRVETKKRANSSKIADASFASPDLPKTAIQDSHSRQPLQETRWRPQRAT
jgi:hypothetical protein